MLKVAVTGNIGSGKSVICRFFQLLGVPVFYSDIEAKKQYHNPEVLHIMVERFGQEILTPEKRLNTKAFAAKIFTDQKALKFVSSIIHPRVYDLYNAWLQNYTTMPYTLFESALIFETGSHKRFDRTLVVWAPEDQLLDRVIKRDHSKPGDVLERMKNQLTQPEKIALADYSLLNDNTTLLIPRLIDLHEKLTGLGELTGQKASG
jgi:dephospho-CoA kinase